MNKKYLALSAGVLVVGLGATFGFAIYQAPINQIRRTFRRLRRSPSDPKFVG